MQYLATFFWQYQPAHLLVLRGCSECLKDALAHHWGTSDKVGILCMSCVQGGPDYHCVLYNPDSEIMTGPPSPVGGCRIGLETGTFIRIASCRPSSASSGSSTDILTLRFRLQSFQQQSPMDWQLDDSSLKPAMRRTQSDKGHWQRYYQRATH